jgi:predicted RNA-binding protein YlqC (UPF0109 family)
MNENELKDTTLAMLQLVERIAKVLVDESGQVYVTAHPDFVGGVTIRLRVAPANIGQVIGKQGRTARSIRTILSAASMKLKHRFSLEIVENEK